MPESLCSPKLTYKSTHLLTASFACSARREGGDVCSAPPHPALLRLLPPQQTLELPWKSHVRLSKDPVSSFLKEVYQDWESHKAGLKSLHGEREQTFLTNWTTAPLCLLSDIWTSECKMGTIRVFPERNWKIERDPREDSQDILHLPRRSSWAITTPSIRAERVNERSSPTSVHLQ